MVYRVIGIMSGSSLDGLDIVFAELEETGGKWNYQIKASSCRPYSTKWKENLAGATILPAHEYLLLNAAYGKYIGEQVNDFIDENKLHHQVQLIASHGHTTFHAPQQGLTAQLGAGAAIAAITQVNVVSDLRAMDVAFGGQGAPIVPVGEKLLFADYPFCLNLGGIANVSYRSMDGYIAFDICAANRVLNMLVKSEGKEYDENGSITSTGNVVTELLTQLNKLSYYNETFPKSLANSFGVEVVYPMVANHKSSTADKLRTYTEHIAMQVSYAVQQIVQRDGAVSGRMLVTGGGAFNAFLIERIRRAVEPFGIEVEVPDATIVNYKEALIMALIGVLRWREEYNVLHTVTGAQRSSIGGAVWIGQEA